MTDQKKALLDIIEETREYLKYASELGIRTFDEQSGAQLDSLPSEPAFEHAGVEADAREVENDQLFHVSETRGGKLEMNSKTDKFPDETAPAPQETLFGTVTPADELSLPRSGETLDDIWNDIGECTRCPLCESRSRVVNSEGNRRARLMFIGEAPGADEDAQGRPFVGRAGQLL